MGWPWSAASAQLPDTMLDGSSWPRISIVTPSFNQGQFIEETIRSVLLQGYPNLEYIIIDGGSTDGSIEIIKKYDERLAYWSSEADKGAAAGLNKGFRHATGEIFGYLNSDDIYLPGCLRRIAGEFQPHPFADVVSGNGYFARESGELARPIFSNRWCPRRFAYEACVIFQPATFFRGEAFRKTAGFNEGNLTCWDAELWADLALAGACFHGLGDFLATFRIHRNSITGGGRHGSQFRLDRKRIFEKIMGRPWSIADRYYAYAYRLMKFCRHPERTLGFRLFLRSNLKRWSL
jgi:glycosyltransferase involved in cell wall biosynthesis